MNYEIQSFEILGQIWQKLQGLPYWWDERKLPPTSQKFADSPSPSYVQYVQYAQNVVCSFEKGSNFWKHLSNSHHLTENTP